MSTSALLISGRMFGGGQQVVLDIHDAASGNAGMDSELLLLGCTEPMLEGRAHHVIPYDGRYNRPNTLLSAAWRLRRVLQRSAPAILHTHGWDADVIGRLALGRMSTRQLIHLHVTPSWLRSGALQHRVRRALTKHTFARKGTQVVAVSEAVRAHWAELLPWRAESIEVVENGIDLDKYRQRAAGTDAQRKPPVVGTAVRLAPSKGVTYLVQAAEQLVARGQPCKVQIAGDGAERPSLEAEVRAKGLADVVSFNGHLTDVSDFYGSLDVYVLPTVAIDSEGLPLGILEAWASGLCVIGTKVKGVQELVRDRMDGLLVPPGDAASLAQAIADVVRDDALRSRLARNGYERVCAEFSRERFLGEIFSRYQKMRQAA